MTPPEEPKEAVLAACQHQLRTIAATKGLGSRALGVRTLDSQLWRMGREWFAPPFTTTGDPHADFPKGGDVYLATQVYDQGGHTALIGDFVRALKATQEGAPAPILIVTNVHLQNSSPVPQAILSRTGIPAENTFVLGGNSLSQRARELFDLLASLRPARLFLFHHPDDPLPCLVAREEVVPLCALVHHADATPSFGLHLPGIRLIELNPLAAAFSRIMGLSPDLLLLTAPDPGPRPGGFLRRGRLVTASCGSPHKFIGGHFYTYAETIGVILESTGGWHVHIGPLMHWMLAEIHGALRKHNVSEGKFVHVPSTASLPGCLWEHDCDVYLSSFPIDGLRANAEVISSSTPHLRHSSRSPTDSSRCELALRDALTWRTWTDLAETLRGLSANRLAEISGKIRAGYEAWHHPRVFAGHLSNILRGHGGVEDPFQGDRDLRAAGHLMNSFIDLGLHQPRTEELVQMIDSLRDQFGQNAAAIHDQKKRIDFLREKGRHLENRIKKLRTLFNEWREGRGPLSRFFRRFRRH